MNKAELEKEVERLKGEILRRDRIIRTCYYRVRQIRDSKQMALLEAMQEWAPAAPWVSSRVYNPKGAT